MFEDPKLYVSSLNKKYGFKAEFSLYHDVNIILGKSGSGKTMLFNCMSETTSVTSAIDRDGNSVPIRYISDEEGGNDVLDLLDLRGIKKVLLITDDVKGFLKNENLLNRIQKYKGETILLFIGRDINGMKGLKFSCFSSAVYVIDENDGKVTLKNFYAEDRLNRDITESYGTVSTCISE